MKLDTTMHKSTPYFLLTIFTLVITIYFQYFYTQNLYKSNKNMEIHIDSLYKTNQTLKYELRKKGVSSIDGKEIAHW